MADRGDSGSSDGPEKTASEQAESPAPARPESGKISTKAPVSGPGPGGGVREGLISREDGKDGGEDTGRAGVDAVEDVVDGPWAWVVTGATFVIHFILYGFIVVSSMYFVVFLKTFGKSSSETSWISSLYLGTLCATGPIAGVVINKWGCRVALLMGGLVSTLGQVTSAFCWDIRLLFGTFGLLTGFGHGLFLMASIVALNDYFRKYRVLALGISLVGTGAGNIIYPYLTRYLMQTHGWRGALIYSAGINLQCCPLAMLVRPIPKPRPTPLTNKKLQRKNSQRKILLKTTTKLFTDIHYWLLCGSNASFVFGISVFITHVAAFAQSVGLSEMRTDHLLSSLGIAALIGRGLTALIAHHKKVDIMLFLVCCYCVAGFAMVSYGINRSFTGLLVSVLLYGLFSSLNGSVSIEYASYVIGSDAFATGYGYVMFANGIGAIGGAPVAGWLYDRSGVYAASFYLSGSCMVLSGLLMFPTYLTRRKSKAAEPPASLQMVEWSNTEREAEPL